jgi:hypothetical protein
MYIYSIYMDVRQLYSWVQEIHCADIPRKLGPWNYCMSGGSWVDVRATCVTLFARVLELRAGRVHSLPTTPVLAVGSCLTVVLNPTSV